MKKCDCKKKPCFICTLFKILFAATGLLFVVYFWNLDQKLLNWAYRQVNKVYDVKKQDIKF